MRSIYVITNQENQKQYVGQTGKTPEERLAKHISNRFIHPERALYKDMNEMGVDVFTIELLEEVDSDLVNERETYWIEALDVIKNGYNDRVEGMFMPKLSEEERNKIVESYKETKNGWKTAKQTNHSSQTVYKILKEKGVKVDGTNERRIQINETGMKFNSITECAQWLQNNEANITPRLLGIIQNIYFVASGKRHKYRGFTFSYVDDE